MFHPVPTEADFGAVDITPIDARALKALRNRALSEQEWHPSFSVWANDTMGTPMLGRYALIETGVRFVPNFPPAGGNTYHARFDAAAFSALSGVEITRGGATGQWTVEMNTVPSKAVVDSIFPTTDSVPMNLLKMYVQFSAPMSIGQVMKRVHVYDDNGSEVHDAFLVPSGGEELWNAERRRVTLLFDPGRIKRDLRPHEEKGLPLQQGHTYRLVIDSLWPDANGRPLARSHEKRFRVGPVDRGLLRASTWRVSAPKAGSTDALELRFPEPLDRALLSRMISVHAADGTAVTGRIEVTDREMRWRFVPANAWAPGRYYIEIDATIEDLAGNSLRRLFDVMPGDTGSFGTNDPSVKIAVVIGK